MRQVYTEKEKRRFIEDYEKSSLSIKDYCQSRNISTYLYYLWKRRFKIEDSPVETDSMAPQFRQIIKPTQVSGLSMTLSNGIRIGLDGMSMEALSSLLVNMGRHA
jgi:transposase-like protein